MSQIHLSGEEARMAILRGINKVGDVIGSTFGPFGKNVSIDGAVTNDGITIAQAYSLDDEAENIGVGMVRDAAYNTNKNAGDGTTTTTVLTKKLCNRFNELVEMGFRTDAIKRQAKQTLKIIKENLHKNSIHIDESNKNILESIAMVSSEDKDIGKLISDIVYRVGKDGVINIEQSQNGLTEIEVFKGIKIDRGFATQYMANDGMDAVYNSISVLVLEKTISDFKELIPILKQIREHSNSVMIVCEEITSKALSDVILTNRQGQFKILVVRGPIGTQKAGVYNDIAFTTGAKLLSADNLTPLSDIDMSYVGNADKIISNKIETIIVAEKPDRDKYIEQLKHEREVTKSDYEKSKISERISRLNNGIGVVYVGGNTEAEQMYLKHKIEDAINATQNAYKYGVCTGGIYGLLMAMPNESESDFTANAIKDSIVSTFRTIYTNGGTSEEEIDEIINDFISTGIFRNPVNNKTYDDPIKEGIIDPVKVLEEAIINSISTALIMISIGNIIINKYENIENQYTT